MPQAGSKTVVPSAPPIWYFDFISPFAYLQFEWLRRERPGLAFELRPVLLGALLHHWGTTGPAEVPSKRVATYRFVLWKARQLGIPLRFPPAHPFNPLPALRLAIAAGAGPDAIEAIFRHIWRDGRALDTVESIGELASGLGIADPEIVISAPAVKAALANHGQAAQASGVFGVPTFVVHDRLFWGLDATDMLLDYLSDPVAFEDGPMRALSTLPVGIERRR